MKWFDLFKYYQLKKIKESKFSYFVIIVSLIISTMVAIAIPLINQSVINNIDVRAKLIIGADLKVETGSIISKRLADKIDQLKDNNKITVSTVDIYQETAKYKKNNVLYYLASGNYDLGDKIIVSKSLANQLEIKVNDKFKIADNNYIVSNIEQDAYGIDQQSGLIGYIKISNKNVIKSSSISSRVYLINTSNPTQIKTTLSSLEGSYRYTTVNDEKKELLDNLKISLMALGAINTISILMTIMAVISSIFMIITQRKCDMAIMKCLSIYTKEIKRSLRFEIKLIVIFPIIIGATLSRFLASYLLSTQGMQFNTNNSPIIVGSLFFIIVYFLFINAATLNITNINALSFFRNSKDGFTSSKTKLIIISGLYFIGIMFVYSIFYLQQSETIVSSFAIIILALIFFLFTIIILKLLTLFKVKNNSLINYTNNSLAANIPSFALNIISSALLVWLILFGFTFERTMGDSYTKSVENTLGYNYMMISSSNEKDVVTDLSENKSVTAYTVVYKNSGIIKNKNQSLEQISLGNIATKSSNVSFKIIQGKQLKDCNDNEILVSKNFITQYKLKLNDKVQAILGNSQYFDTSSNSYTEYIISGIYDSAGINDNLLLHNSTDTNGHLMYLVNDTSDNLLNSMDEVTAVNISILGTGIQNVVAQYLVYFKLLCLICILTSLFFCLNMLYMRYYDYTDVIIGQAIGLTRKFFFKSAIIKNVLSIIISGALAFCIYILTASQVLKLLNIKMVISPNMLILPLICILLFYLFNYFTEIHFIKKRSTDYEVLRERR
jgi:putative ABC transport system permease protein